MDSITHALYKAIVVQDAAGDEDEDNKLRKVGEAAAHLGYADATPSTLFIQLDAYTPELLALSLELTAAGLAPPSDMALEGLDVLIGTGCIELHTVGENGLSWCACLATTSYDGPNRRMSWRNA